ncbi:MAG TPA: alpha/beta fold hydrolase [Terracidiphilus sp.]
MTPIRKLLWAAVVLVAVVIAAAVGFVIRPLMYFNTLLYIQMQGAGAHSGNVMVGGHRIHYYVMGPAHGKPVVLVHGLGGRSEDWRNLSPYLARAGFRIYTPDLPGYGRSEKPADYSYSIPDEADAVVGFMDAVGLKQVDLGGWSMGGWIVQRLAASHPERVARLMLFDSAGIYEAPAWDTRLFTPASSVEMEQLDALLMPHPPKVPGFIMADILRVSRQDAWVIHRALASMLAGRDATDSILPTLKMPVLIVWGGEDRITPLTQGEKIHRLVPQSQLEVIPPCGHLAPVQCADQIGPSVTEFLK